MIKCIFLVLLCVFSNSQPYLCCDTNGGIGNMQISTVICDDLIPQQYSCKFDANWINQGEIDWSQIMNTPKTLDGYGIKNFPN